MTRPRLQINPSLCLLLAVMPLLAACSLRRPAVVTDSFLLQLGEPRAGSPVMNRHLAVLPVSIAPQFNSQPFVYRTGEARYTADFYNRFFAPPNQLLTEALRRWLEFARVGESVIEPASPLRANAMVQAHVAELYADYRNPQQPMAIVALRILLIDRAGEDDVLVFSKLYRRVVPMPRPVASEAILAWSRGVEGIFADFARDARNRLPPAKKPEPEPPTPVAGPSPTPAATPSAAPSH